MIGQNPRKSGSAGAVSGKSTRIERPDAPSGPTLIGPFPAVSSSSMHLVEQNRIRKEKMDHHHYGWSKWRRLSLTCKEKREIAFSERGSLRRRASKRANVSTKLPSKKKFNFVKSRNSRREARLSGQSRKLCHSESKRCWFLWNKPWRQPWSQVLLWSNGCNSLQQKWALVREKSLRPARGRSRVLKRQKSQLTFGKNHQ